jgi:superfamily II DNA or RNA helicase
MLRLSFDRGTLRLDDAPRALLAALSDDARFDDRTGHHRAPAYRYARLLELARDQGAALEDAVARDFPRRRSRPAPSLRAYQEQAVSSFETFGRRGVVALPTGSGKTRVALAAIARARTSALVLVPTRVLLDQWTALLRDQFGAPIGAVGDRQRSLEDITVMTFESAYRCLDRFGARFEMLVVDEAHHFSSGLRAEALEMCPAPIRLGLTATPPLPGTAGAARLVDLLGPTVFELEIADLAGTALADLDVVRVHVALSADERARYRADIEPFESLRRDLLRVAPDADWLTCVRAIARTPGGSEVLGRMQRAGALAGFPSAKRALVRDLIGRHRHDRTLLFTACAGDAVAIASDCLIPVITADVPREERDAILTAFRDRRVRAIASARVLNEGVDVPEANVAIIVAGALGAREHVQRIGRILRPQSGKRAIAYELVTMDTIDEARTRARGRRLAAGRAARRHVA